jgi:hypothetical protein
MGQSIRYPFGDAAKLALAVAVSLAATIDNGLTLLDITGNLTADTTLTFSTVTGMVPGSEVIVRFTCGSNAYNLILAGTADAVTVTGVASKTTSVRLILLANGKFSVVAVNSYALA